MIVDLTKDKDGRERVIIVLARCEALYALMALAAVRATYVVHLAARASAGTSSTLVDTKLSMGAATLTTIAEAIAAALERPEDPCVG